MHHIVNMASGEWQLSPTGENTDQESSSSETEPEDPNDSADEKFNRDFDSALSISEKHNGEWLTAHPWNSDNKPDPKRKMEDTVAMSSTHPLSPIWVKGCKDSQKYVDLGEIFSRFQTFVQREMQGSVNGSRQELEWLVNRDLSRQSPVRKLNPSDLSPHTREIVDVIKQDHRNDNKSLPGDKHLKATSIGTVCTFSDTDHMRAEYTFYFDCEYTLKMYANTLSVPVLTWFDVPQCDHNRGQIQWIRKIRYKYKEKRWIFIPSFRRAQIALLEWPKDDIVTEETTIRLLVVRPSEFKEYVKYCGHKVPVICLPQDEIGAGYPRYWIQKIALRLKLQFIWMIDDSVECFYEYHPSEEPPYQKDEKGKLVCNYRDYRRRKFSLVFERIEDFVQDADDNVKPIAAMSPRRWNPKSKPKKPFSCKPPQGAVYLNLRALSEKKVYYRPELKTFEDMIFGYECEQKGLKVYRDNRILLQDHKWKDTGASSPSVKAVDSTASTALVEEIETKNVNNKCVLL